MVQLVLLVLLALGIVRSAFHVASDIAAVKASTTWPSLEGRVIWVAKHTATLQPLKRSRYRVVRYEYRVHGYRFEGNRVDFDRRNDWRHYTVKKFVESLLADPFVMVYYDPEAPDHSVIQPGGSNRANVILLIGQVVVASAIVAFLSFVLRRSRHAHSRNRDDDDK